MESYVESFDGTAATCCKRILTATSKVTDWPNKYKILEKGQPTPPLTNRHQLSTKDKMLVKGRVGVVTVSQNLLLM